MIHDYRLLLRPFPDDGRLALPFDLLDGLSHTVRRRLSGSIWDSTSHPPFQIINFSSYLDAAIVHQAIEGALADQRVAWILGHDNRQEFHGWSAVESLEWYRLFRTGTRD